MYHDLYIYLSIFEASVSLACKGSNQVAKIRALNKLIAPLSIIGWSRDRKMLTSLQLAVYQNLKGWSLLLYALPDPALLCSDSPKARAKKCRVMVVHAGKLALSKQSWRDVLLWILPAIGGTRKALVQK